MPPQNELAEVTMPDSENTGSQMDPTLSGLLRGQKYQLIGRNTAVKKCRWLHKSLVEGKRCYKAKFYGIKSHRCLQMTPSTIWCTQRCLYCWRIQKDESDFSFDMPTRSAWDDPSKIVDYSLKAQRKILSGYNSQVLNGKVDPKIYREALEPKHAAISLTGEPTLYPQLDELISEFHNHGLTTFLVTNGTRPEVLKRLSEEPTQLYISLSAPSFEKYKEICRPRSSRLWQKLMGTLELVKSFSCPTAVRITLVKGLNLQDPQGYAKLISRAEPTYVEPKSYMYLGDSRKRLKFTNMPSHDEIREFSSRLSELTGYRMIDESSESRVVLLSRLEKPIKVSSD